jgi:hypothetical protein
MKLRLEECSALTEVIGAAHDPLRFIDAFEKCTPLHRVEIPALVDLNDGLAFWECTLLTEAIFSNDR